MNGLIESVRLMPVILALETSTAVCSVALARDGEIIAIRENREGRSHATLLTVFIGEILNEAKLKPEELDAVAVSIGPGSYTGLRIGLSAAKGFCFSANKPLIAVPTLQAMAWNAVKMLDQQKILPPYCLLPMIDARRMEVYTAVFDNTLKAVMPAHSLILDDASGRDMEKYMPGYYFGDGAEKARKVLSSNNHLHFMDVIPSAAGVLGIAFEKFRNKEFEDLELSEPFYLKEYIAGR